MKDIEDNIYGNQVWKRQCFHQESKTAPVHVQGGDRRRGRSGANKSLQAKIREHDQWW